MSMLGNITEKNIHNNPFAEDKTVNDIPVGSSPVAQSNGSLTPEVQHQWQQRLLQERIHASSAYIQFADIRPMCACGFLTCSFYVRLLIIGVYSHSKNSNISSYDVDLVPGLSWFRFPQYLLLPTQSNINLQTRSCRGFCSCAS